MNLYNCKDKKEPVSAEEGCVAIFFGIIAMLFLMVVSPAVNFVIGYFYGMIVKLFLSNAIVHDLAIFGIIILPEQLPSICATLNTLGYFFRSSLSPLLHDTD